MTDEHWRDAPAVGVGACLLGQPVRHDGSARRRNTHLEALAGYFALRPFCPEVAIGLGVPRPAIRLVGERGAERAVDSATGSRDVTGALRAQAARLLAAQPDLSGYVLVKGSPSCGMERVRRYGAGGVPVADAGGVFAAALMAADPLLPVEEDGRLHDDALRESFVARVFTYAAWRRLCAAGLSHKALLDFYARRKYLVMSRHVPTYRELGRLLAGAGAQPPEALAQAMMPLLMAALRRPATRRGHTNALQHIRGYLKGRLSGDEQSELDEVIEHYRRGSVPLVAPMTLLQHHFRRHPHPYIEQQLFMQPYPAALGLRNGI